MYIYRYAYGFLSLTNGKKDLIYNIYYPSTSVNILSVQFKHSLNIYAFIRYVTENGSHVKNTHRKTFECYRSFYK